VKQEVPLRYTSTLPLLLVGLAAGCTSPEPTAPPATPPPRPLADVTTTGGFSWATATPESQGMCGSTKQLGCTKTLASIWTAIHATIYNTKRFIVIRNDKVIFSKGNVAAYHAYSASKGLLGAPTLVYAMSRCGVGLKDPAGNWLGHADGSRWITDFPWSSITVEQLATHTSGVCDYENTNTVCRNENSGWQTAYDKARYGGSSYAYPKDLFTVARAKSEQNREPALDPGSVYEYSNTGHSLLNYVVQRACGMKLTAIYDTYIKQWGIGSALNVPLISTDDGQQFNQSTGIAKWNGLDGASVLRLAGRRGVWENQNVQPVRYWNLLTKISDNIAAAAAVGWGVVYNNNSMNMWTADAGHRRLSQETFGHGGNYSNIFINDPLTSTIIVRQGENNANGASYLTTNGCRQGWTGTAPSCSAGTNWSNNWNVSSGAVNFSTIGPRKKVVDPVQEAFFFPPPFCRLTTVGGTLVDNSTDIYSTPSGASSIDLEAEITVNPREGAGSSAVDKIQFYKESGGGVTEYIGDGILVPGSSPARFQLSYSADSHGAEGEVRTYFANCIAKSTQNTSKKVPSYSRPVRVGRG
jgi:CubicO group peptidase (beta-lactamase class C family)